MSPLDDAKVNDAVLESRTIDADRLVALRKEDAAAIANDLPRVRFECVEQLLVGNQCRRFEFHLKCSVRQRLVENQQVISRTHNKVVWLHFKATKLRPLSLSYGQRARDRRIAASCLWL
jgi:hypothetical protein